MGKYIDIVGQKFGRLTAIRFDHISNSGNYFWLFKCDCGNEIVSGKGDVKGEHTKSCGCLKKDFPSSITHGMSKTRFNGIWCSIKTKCSNENTFTFRYYGGRGIKCLWNSFEEFRNDMYESYLEHCKEFGVKNTTIDRINNNGHYCKENCRWATRKEQSRNQRTNRILTLNGQSKCLAEWAEITGIDRKIIGTRIDRYHWPIERALTTPPRILT